MAERAAFDPRTILAALEGAYVDYVMIGGLAQVLRGADVVTRGVDICPSFARGNVERLARAVDDLGTKTRRRPPAVNEERLAEQLVVRVTTAAGEFGLVGSPAGVPNGYVDLRRAATREDLGAGVRPLVASAGDLAAMAAALGRKQDLARLAMLRRVAELEVRRPAPATATEKPAARRRARGMRPQLGR